jgi:lipopolysaccharide transport system permease protein
MNNTITEKTAWTSVIGPRRGWFEIDLKEIWQYRDLVMLFVRRDFVAKYKQTILGPLWFLLQPLLTTLIFTVIFGRIAGISTDGVPMLLFYLSGIVAWNFFANSLTETSGTFINNASIFGKVYFPRLVLPLSMTISGFLTFIIQFLLLMGFMIYFYISGAQITLTANLLYLPLLVVLLALQGLGFGIIISSLTIKYRDLAHLVKFGVQLWMFATPIIYPISAIPQKYQFLVMANPVSPLIESFRNSLLGTGTVRPDLLVYSLVWTVIVFSLGILVFNKVEKNFMDTV